MKARISAKWGLAMLLIVLLAGHGQVNGQLGEIAANLLGGGTTNTPAATTAATPSSTPASTPATPADPPADATPASTPAATTAPPPDDDAADPPATPAAVTAVTPSTPTTKATPASAVPATGVALNNVSVISVTPRVTPRATAKPLTPPPAPPPPVPIVIDQSKLVDALPTDETQPLNNTRSATDAGTVGQAGLTAADMVVQVSGSGVTPFGIPQQTILLRSVASVLTTVSLTDLSIRYVTSSANIAGRRLLSEMETKGHRHLLQDDSGADAAAKKGDLYNVATVTVQANCSSASTVGATLTEMQSVLQQGLLASALQYYNATSWGVNFLSVTSVDPTVALDLTAPCRKNLGKFCLDNTSLSVSAAEAIIGIGCFFVIMLLTIPCVFLEWRRRSGRMVELEPTPETPKSPLQKVQVMYNSFISTVKQASPMHRNKNSAQNVFRETPRRTEAAEEKKPSQAVNIHASAQR